MIPLKQTVIKLAWVFLRGQIRDFLGKNKEEVLDYVSRALKDRLQKMDFPGVEGKTEEDLKNNTTALARTALQAAMEWLEGTSILN